MYPIPVPLPPLPGELAVNRLSVEAMRELPGVKIMTCERHHNPSPAVYNIQVHTSGLDQLEEPEGFYITMYYDRNEAIDCVSIEALTSGDGYHTDTTTFPQMRTFEELKEVCRLMHIQYPENWP